MAAAQKGSNNTVADFFKKYSEYSGYQSIEVTEDMFEMFKEVKNADPEMVQFLTKLKYVRYLEYEGGGLVTGISVVTPVKGSKAGTLIVDGKPIAQTGKSKKKNSGKSTIYVEGKPITTTTNVSTAKSGGMGTSKASNIVPISEVGGSVVYSRAIDEINLKSYKQLMKANHDGEKMVFLKKEFTSNPTDQEFLLIQGNTMINIRGDINITHLYELEDILEAIGEILPI